LTDYGKSSLGKNLAIIFGVAIIAGVSVYGVLAQDGVKIPAEQTEKEIAIGSTLIQQPSEFLTTEGLEGLGPVGLGRVFALQIISNCYNDLDCALNSLREVENTRDEQTVLSTFTQLVSQFDENKIECHETAHHLGAFLYPYVGKDLTKAFEYAGQGCGGAIYHGIIQNYFAIQRYNDVDPDTIKIVDVCPRFEDHPYEIERWQCLHGIGHGLIVAYDYDVFSAVKRCNVFESGWEQISCSKGIFMQNNVKYVESREGNFDEDNILYPCNEVDAKYAPRCYHYHPTYILIQNGGSIKKSFADCDRIGPDEFVKYCYHGMGRQMLPATEGKMSLINQFCQMGEQQQFHTDCFRGMVMILVNNDRDPEEGFVFCKNIPDTAKEDCYDGLGKWITMLQPDDEQRSKECSRAESLEYFATCMNASLENMRLF